jgi:hypothetical protein
MCTADWARSKIQQRGGWSELTESDVIYALSLPSDTAQSSSGLPQHDRVVTTDDFRWLQVFHNPILCYVSFGGKPRIVFVTLNWSFG